MTNEHLISITRFVESPCELPALREIGLLGKPPFDRGSRSRRALRPLHRTMPAPAMDTSGKTAIPENKRHLGLVSGARPQRMNLKLTLHFLYVFLPHIRRSCNSQVHTGNLFELLRPVFTLPLTLLWHHLIARFRSPVVQVVGRPFYSDYIVKLSQYILSRCTVAQARMLFNRDKSYNTALAAPQFRGYRDWVTYVDVNGTTGRWIAPPHTDRSKDEVVLYFIHGEFVRSTATASAMLSADFTSRS